MNGMAPNEEARLNNERLLNPASLLVALFFGFGAMAVVLAGLTIPIPGSDVVSDPRELCTTIGAALTGPIGGVIIGFLAGICEPVVVLPSTIAHIAGGLWMGFAYKKLVYERLAVPQSLIGWFVLVLTYFYVIFVPCLVVGQAVILVVEQSSSLSAFSFLPRTYATLATGVTPEAMLTSAMTALMLAAVPRKYHRPLWGTVLPLMGVQDQGGTTVSSSQLVASQAAVRSILSRIATRLNLFKRSFAWRLAILLLLMTLLPIGVMAVFIRNTVAESFIALGSLETQVQARQLAADLTLLPDESAVRNVLSASSDGQHLALAIGLNGEYVVAPNDYRASRSAEEVLSSDAVSRMEASHEGVFTDATNGHVVGYARVPGKDVVAVVILEGSVIYDSVQQMETTSFVQLAASLLIIVVIGVVAIWVVMSPIQRLTRAAEEVGAGRLNVAIDPLEMEGELAVLAKAFNQMTRRLQESYDTLERRVALRTEELATLNSISALVSQSLDLEEILQTAIDKTMEIGSFDMGGAYRLEDDGKTLTLLAHRGLAEDIVHDVASVRAEVALGGVAIETGQPSVREISDYPDGDFKYSMEKNGMRTVVVVPLVAKGRVVGALGLAIRSVRQLTSQDISLLSAIGQQVGMAVENARLYEHAEQSAVAAERNRLARDLHDAVTQTLFSASLIADVLPRIAERNPEEARRRLEELRQLTRGALAEMRTLLLELRPAALTEAPLENLLRHLAEATTGRARIPISLAVEEGISVPTDVHVAFYRIAQESLNNVAKHSGAKKAEVVMRQSDREVELVIGDDGCGFDESQVSSDHLGLDILRERAQSIGASLQVESEKNVGTRITVSWPKPDVSNQTGSIGDTNSVE